MDVPAFTSAGSPLHLSNGSGSAQNATSELTTPLRNLRRNLIAKSADSGVRKPPARRILIAKSASRANQAVAGSATSSAALDSSAAAPTLASLEAEYESVAARLKKQATQPIDIPASLFVNGLASGLPSEQAVQRSIADQTRELRALLRELFPPSTGTAQAALPCL